MNRQVFQMLMEKEFHRLVETNNTKGHDYAGDDDALDNFKRMGRRFGLTKFQAWGIYAGKHWDAIETFIREGAVQSEPIEGRIHDLILYGFLLLGLITEDEKTQETTNETGNSGSGGASMGVRDAERIEGG